MGEITPLVSAAKALLPDDGLEQRWAVLEHILSIIQMADTKATALMAVTTVALSIIASSIVDAVGGAGVFAAWSDVWWPINLFTAIGLTTLAASLCFSLVCLIGRTGPPIWARNGTMARSHNSLIFFGAVARRDRWTYVQDFAAVSGDDFQTDLSVQIHVLSLICSKKYWYLNGSYYLLLTSFLCLAASGALVLTTYR